MDLRRHRRHFVSSCQTCELRKKIKGMHIHIGEATILRISLYTFFCKNKVCCTLYIFNYASKICYKKKNIVIFIHVAVEEQWKKKIQQKQNTRVTQGHTRHFYFTDCKNPCWTSFVKTKHFWNSNNSCRAAKRCSELITLFWILLERPKFPKIQNMSAWIWGECV